MNPSEVEFFGEKRLVSIVPNFNLDVIHLISGPVGPFRAGLPVKVPIWLAMCLKQKQKCRIVNQEWMDPEGLNERKEMEKMSKYGNRRSKNSLLPALIHNISSYYYYYSICVISKLILLFNKVFKGV